MKHWMEIVADSGRYYCVGSSVPGSDSQEIELVVQGELPILNKFGEMVEWYFT